MQTSPDWSTVDNAFARALELEGSEREAFLASLDSAIRSAVDPLLRDSLRDFPLLDRPEEVVAPLVAHGDGPGVTEGVLVGPYRIENLVGEGGMGRVYRARRADGAFNQTVAVKVVRQSLALAGSDVAARLRRERALLATLDHPNIARLIDGGETDDGVPYLVTEFVDGEPLTTWADSRGLDLRDRVRLMTEVARAVDHAHRRLVVHRDLKPSNVLVTERDGTPRPVVLDFGIAKLLDDPEGEGTAAFPITRTGMRMLTPAYAAPELYEPTATITTASDVYGLGALLYEVLTGLRPHDDAPTVGPPTTEPTKPSKAVTSAAPSDGTHVSDPATRSRALRGDLDTICLKALHPDSARRYSSAEALADDLERYLSGRPVEARPDSLAYVVGRFARRHRPAVFATTVALLALISGLGASLVLLASEREAVTRAERSADQATAAASALANLFDGANPEYTSGEEMSAREALDLGLTQVGSIEDESLRGYLMVVLGQTYYDIGDIPLADSLLTNGIALVDSSATSPLALAESYYALARLRGNEGRNDQALDYITRAHGLASRHRGDIDLLAARYPETAALLFNTTRDRAWIYRQLGRYDEAVEWADRAIRMARNGEVPEETVTLALFERAVTHAEAGRLEEAAASLRETVDLSERYNGGDHNQTAYLRGALADILRETGEYEESLALSQTGVEASRRIYGTGHFRVADQWARLGRTLLAQGESRSAVVYLDSAMTAYRTLEMAEFASSGWTFSELIVARNRLGEHERAEREARQALRIEALEADSTYAARVRGQLGIALAARGRRGEARAHLEAGLTASDDLPARETEDIRAALATIRRASSTS